MKYIDRKTGNEVKVGDSLIRKNYKGFKTRYEILEFKEDCVHVRKLDATDRWVFLYLRPEALQLDVVMI